MGVSKGLNRLAILGLLACGVAWAQSTVPVKVGLTTPGPIFLVDGQPYTTPQVFQWTVGSNHQVYFLQSMDPDGTLGNHQFATTFLGMRYTFGGWSVIGQATPPAQGTLLLFTVESTLTQIIGNATTEVRVSVSFSGFTDPTLPCSATNIPADPRQGIILVGSACVSAPADIWVTPGQISLTGLAFPGFIFKNWIINGNTITAQQLPAYPIGLATDIQAVFVKAKRVRFRSNPSGLTLLLDHLLVQPSLLAGMPPTDPYCQIDYSRLPVNFPLGYSPLCVGDFDLLPGSQHVLGAPVSEVDAFSNAWVFTGFSNGLGQNGVYTADFNTDVIDVVFGNFVSGVPTRVLTNPPGLTVNVDGQDDTQGMNRLWGAGQNHHIIAPLTQTDSTKHPWKFASWSSGGTADQTYTVPTGLAGLTLTAIYEPQGKLQVDSAPSGLPFNVDGVACTTPCILLDKPTGAVVQVVAPASLAPDAFKRFTFKSWNDGNTSTTLQVTIGDHAKVLVAAYQAFYKLTASSQPANRVSFAFNPSTADGFYTDGTRVTVTASPNSGFTFKNWSGDLSGTDLTASLVMNGPKFAVAVLNGFPFISDNGVKNAAGDTPSGTVGPGSLISIFGSDLADQVVSSPQGELDQSLNDVWVTLNDRLLPLLFVSPGQINAQLFSDLQDGNYTLTVHHTTQADASKNFTVKRDSPGIFQWNPAQGNPTVLAFHADGSVLDANSPATANETVSIYGTGFGLYDQPLVDGFPTPNTGNWNVADPVRVTVDGLSPLTPLTTRAANGYTGMVIVRVKLPGTLPSGSLDIKVTVNNVDSNTSKLPTK